MPTPEQLLESGALIPVKSKLKDDSAVDAISARSYQHPALGDRTVVRLSADNLAAGDDLTMDFLGFVAPTVAGPLARRSRQALGFPEWALINDPKHARYALELVKEFKREARRARSKPGHAYDAFLSISDRLGKSVAHFLPSFWEQIGREFIAAGNSTYASRAFGKAREAERTHNLDVDEQIRRDAFLEFALAGCVSAKALTDYGKELQSAHEPAAAWAFMRDLTVRRTLGGLPPWTNMCRDLQGLIKSAGLDPKQELQDVLEQVLDSPAIARAPMGFWKGASKFIAELVKNSDRAAGILLNLIPKTSSWRNEDIWPWLDYLKNWGILSNAWKSSLSLEAAPQDSPAAWLGQIVKCGSALRQQFFDLLVAMADRLKTDDIPLDLYLSNQWNQRVTADVDAVDLALSLGIKVADPPQNLRFELNQWASTTKGDTPRDRPRDPVALMRDSRFRRVLLDAVRDVAGEPQFELAAAGKAALYEARREWLLNLIHDSAAGGLPDVEDKLQILERRTSARTFDEFPEAVDELKKLDLLPAATRTIQAGLMDEYGWPKLEEVFESFAGEFQTNLKVAEGKSKPSVYGAFPYGIVCDGFNAVVVRGDDIVHKAEVSVPKGMSIAGLQYLDGDLLVEARQNYQRRIFWNSKPQDFYEGWTPAQEGLSGCVIDMPQGGTFVSNRIVHAGDRNSLNVFPTNEYFFDGEHFWLRGFSANHEGRVIREVDPITGNEGRTSMPLFFEEFISEDTNLSIEHLQLLKFGDLINESPLGSRDGMVGFRVRRYPSGATETEGVDGRSIRSEKTDVVFEALLNQPATRQFLPIARGEYNYRVKYSLTIRDPTGRYQIAVLRSGTGPYNRGQVVATSHEFLHCFRIRDKATSKKLRNMTDKQVQQLAAAAADDFDAYRGEGAPAEGTDYPLLDSAIRKLLPKLKSKRLHVGLRSIIVLYAQKLRQLNRVLTKTTSAAAVQTTVITGADASIEPTMERLRHRINVPPNANVFGGVAQAVRFFREECDDCRIPDASVGVIANGICQLPRKAWGSYWIQEDQSDTTWLTFMQALADSGILDLQGFFRFFSAEFSDDSPVAAASSDASESSGEQFPVATAYTQKRSRFLISKSWRSFRILEYSPDGRFEQITGSREQSTPEVFQCTWNSKHLHDFVAGARTSKRELPPVPFLQQVADEMRLSLAEVSLIWFAYPNMQGYTSANFMPKHLREGMKLKTKPVSAAKESLKALPQDVQQDLIVQMLKGNPDEYWQQPPEKMAARLKTAWKKLKPNRLELTTEMVEKLSTAFGHHQNATKLLVALNEPESSSMFSASTKYELSAADGDLSLKHNASDDPFDFHVLNAVALTIPWIAYHLPVGDTARERLVAVHDATLKALDNPKLLLDAGNGYFYNAKEQNIAAQAAEAALGKKLKTVNGVPIGDDGTLTVGHVSWRLQRAFRPLKLRTDRDYEKLQQQLDATTQQEYRQRNQTVDSVKLIRSDDFRAICQRIMSSPVPAGRFETNPLLSCPKLVKKVMKELSVSEDAAMYYLQLLTLADPTDANVKAWNDWKTATLKKATSELLETERVLEAKRSRAGRKVFLPGGWEALKTPHLPLETWKLSLFDIARDSSGRPAPPLSRILPLRPVHQLFAQAWQRVIDGDEPKYEEVT